jgi:hypothetical protein
MFNRRIEAGLLGYAENRLHQSSRPWPGLLTDKYLDGIPQDRAPRAHSSRRRHHGGLARSCLNQIAERGRHAQIFGVNLHNVMRRCWWAQAEVSRIGESVAALSNLSFTPVGPSTRSWHPKGRWGCAAFTQRRISIAIRRLCAAMSVGWTWARAAHAASTVRSAGVRMAGSGFRT